MIKKILVSICVLFSFFLIFLFGLDKITILAYSDIGNALGSYPVKLDIDNYDTTNILYVKETNKSFNGVDIQTFYDNNISINGTSTNSFSLDIPINTLNGYYNVKFFESGYVSSRYAYGFYNNNTLIAWVNTNTLEAKNVDLTGANYIKLFVDSGRTFTNYSLKVMATKPNINISSFSSPFKFGYNVNYSLAVNNLTSTQVDAGIAITDSNGNYLKTGTCVIPADSSTICSNINDTLYLPFNIDNNGYVSFDYSLGLFLGPVAYLSVTPNDSGLNFVPVFSAYYKGSPTNNLYFKDRYTFNNLFLSGFNVSVNSSTLSRVLFPRTQVDSQYSMNTNKIVNFATDKKIETGIYNYINYVDFINSSPNDIYSFVITTGISSPGFFDNRIYTISFSNLSLKVNGDSSNSSPLPNNPSTINKYSECSAWYDIPCQLGNGLTYVIYEAPIISPVLTFIVSFITMFSSLVSFVDLFRSFGIVFGCFIIYMFINLLHKYSK